MKALTDDITRSFNLIRGRLDAEDAEQRRRPMADARTTASSSTTCASRWSPPEGGPIYCGAKVGDHFELRGEMLHLPPGQGISIYSLASVLPLLAAKQRPTHTNDWMTTDAEIACPDPHCRSRLQHHAARPAPLQPCRNHGGAAR